jgi:hypothetical protein
VSSPWLLVLGWLTLTRVVILLIGLVGAATFVDAQTKDVAGPAALSVQAVWHKWDALWYERIATEGYAYTPDDIQGQAKTAFFPLYPVVIGLLLNAVPVLSFFWVGALFSTLCTFAACLLITRVLVPVPNMASRVLMLLLSAAGSFYFSLPYTEGLFLLLVVGAMVLTRRRQYAVAALVAGLAAVTRVHGLALFAVPFVACWLDPDQTRSARLRNATLAAVLFAIPVATYLVFLSSGHGSAGIFIDRQAMWSNAFPYPFRSIVGLMEFPRRLQAYLHAGTWILYLGLTIRYARRMPFGECLFCLGALVISTQQETFQGIYRYVAVLVPLVLALADDDPPVRSTVVAINLIFGTIMILAFVTHHRLAV